MAEATVARTLDVSTDALWRCVRAFDEVPWIPGGDPAEIRGEGVGQLRILDRPNGPIHEQLTSLDEAARQLTYAIPQGNPLRVSEYEATMSVSDDGGKGRLSWSGRFEPDGASEDEIAERLRKSYGALIDRIEAYLQEG